MHPRFAETYVENLFSQRNLSGLPHLISVVERDRELPEQCWLFCRLLEWRGSRRSGIWQYYEGLPQDEFERIAKAAEDAGLKELANKYRHGKAAWNTEDNACSLDKWMDANREFISSELMCLLGDCREIMKKVAAA